LPSKEGTSRTFSYKCTKTKSTILSEDQLQDFFQALKEISPLGFLFANLQYQGSRRVSEVICLKLKNISFEENNIYYTAKKTRNQEDKQVMVHYIPKIFDLIKEFLLSQNRVLSESDNEEYLFRDEMYPDISIKPTLITSIYKRAWKKIAKDKEEECGEKKTWFPKSMTHTLRSTSINSYIDKGLELSKICLLSGHSRVDTLRIYDNSQNKFNPSLNNNLLNWL
jgi:site-specific recombinase XerD